jgi:hypothetical protein
MYTLFFRIFNNLRRIKPMSFTRSADGAAASTAPGFAYQEAAATAAAYDQKASAPPAATAAAANVAQSTLTSANGPGAAAKKAEETNGKPAGQKPWHEKAWDATRYYANKVWQWMKNIFYACFPCFGSAKTKMKESEVPKAFLTFLQEKDLKDVTAKFAELFTTEQQAVIKSIMGKDADQCLADVSVPTNKDAIIGAVNKFENNRLLNKFLVVLSVDVATLKTPADKAAWERKAKIAWMNLGTSGQAHIEAIESAARKTTASPLERGKPPVENYERLKETLEKAGASYPPSLLEYSTELYGVNRKNEAGNPAVLEHSKGPAVAIMMSLNPSLIKDDLKADVEALLAAPKGGAPAGAFYIAPAKTEEEKPAKK